MVVASMLSSVSAFADPSTVEPRISAWPATLRLEIVPASLVTSSRLPVVSSTPEASGSISSLTCIVWYAGNQRCAAHLSTIAPSGCAFTAAATM